MTHRQHCSVSVVLFPFLRWVTHPRGHERFVDRDVSPKCWTKLVQRDAGPPFSLERFQAGPEGASIPCTFVDSPWCAVLPYPKRPLFVSNGFRCDVVACVICLHSRSLSFPFFFRDGVMHEDV